MNITTERTDFSGVCKSMFKRKCLVLVITGVFLIVPLVIMLPQKQKVEYESEAIIQVGQYRNVREDMVFLEKPDQMPRRLSFKYPKLTHVESQGSGYFILRAGGTSESEAQNSLQKILKDLLAYHDGLYAKAREIFIKRINFYREQAKSVKAYISDFSTSFKRPAGSSKEPASMLPQLHLIEEFVRMEYALKGGERMDKIMEKIMPYSEILAFDFQQTKVVREPTVSLLTKPSKTLKYTMISSVLGLLVGLFCAFCLAYRDYLLELYKKNN